MEAGFSLKDSKVGIFGVGLMGGSLALALKGKCAALYGIDSDRATLELAFRQNIVDLADDDPAKVLPKVDLVILAAPVPAILTLLEQLPGFTPNRCIVLDLGSTKQWIVETMSRLPERFDPIGGHPICGKEKLSLANAEQTLYRDAQFVLTPLERTTPRALSAANQIIGAIGAKVTLLDAAEHDRILASTSHLPFLLASALALTTTKDAASFIGPGFKSVSRLAGTPSSMMLGVLESNRENILNTLHNLQNQLAEIDSALSLENFSKLGTILKEAQCKYQTLVQ